MTVTTVLANVRDYHQREAPLGSQTPYADPVSPGMLLVMNADGEVLPHATAGGAAATPLYIAIENIRPDGGGVESEYSEEGESVSYHIGLPGEKFQMLLAAGQDIAYNAKLTSNGDGTLKAVGGGTAFFVAREAVDNDPGSNSEPVFILVEVI